MAFCSEAAQPSQASNDAVEIAISAIIGAGLACVTVAVHVREAADPIEHVSTTPMIKDTGLMTESLRAWTL